MPQDDYAGGLSLLALHIAHTHELFNLGMGAGVRDLEDVRKFLHGWGNPLLFMKRRISFNVQRCGSVISWTGRLPLGL
jgi:hypothetical protein